MPVIDMAKHAREIARGLGDGWKATPLPGPGRAAARLHGPDGAELYLITDSYATPLRLEIRGVLDRDYVRDSEAHHKITVSVARSADEVARDITRRLLPGYLPAAAATQERKRMAGVAAAERDALIEALVKCLGKDAHRIEHGGDISFGPYVGKSVHGTVRVPSGPWSVTWELEIPQDQCARFASMVLALRSQ